MLLSLSTCAPRAAQTHPLLKTQKKRCFCRLTHLNFMARSWNGIAESVFGLTFKSLEIKCACPFALIQMGRRYFLKWQRLENSNELPMRFRNSAVLERLKENCSHFRARIFGLWRGFGEGAGLQNPVTEPKRSQYPKRPRFLPPEWLQLS